MNHWKNTIKNTFKTLAICLLIFLTSPVSVFAFDANSKINIYKTSDSESRDQLNISSIKNTNFINFYVDQYWWSKQNAQDQSKVTNFATALGSEFEYNIYPKLIKVLPNISNWLGYSQRLNIILTPMNGGVQGYIRWEDFSQAKGSNNGTIVYLNSNNILNPSMSNNILFSFFAHEFMHVITFWEKNVYQNIEESTWLEELRSEYLANYLGYNKSSDSYLNFRLQNGVSLTDINLINWNNTSNSYSLINLFGIYLVQRYSPTIVFETLGYKLSGIDAINSYLAKHGFKERFKDIYQDWVIANILNNCEANINYCYKDIDIQINIPGTSFYLPINNDSVLSISDSLANYQTKYQKIVGGADNLELSLENTKNNIYQKIPYILIDKNNQKTLSFFSFNTTTEQRVIIRNYSKSYSNIIIIPMFASIEDSSQIFKWNINSTRNIIVVPGTKPTTTKPTTSKPTTTTLPNNKTTTTTNPEFGTATPIIININAPERPTSWFSRVSFNIIYFIQKLFSKRS
jgi:hypothetical protein